MKSPIVMKNNTEILKIALSLFSQYGAKASMDEIARVAAISKKTLYQQFRSKAELILSLLELTEKEWGTYTEKLESSEDNPLLLLIGFYKYRYDQIIRLNSLFLVQSAKYFPDARDIYDRVSNKTDQVVELLLKRAQDMQMLHEEVDVETLVRCHKTLFRAFMSESSRFEEASYQVFKHMILLNIIGAVKSNDELTLELLECI
ncbi:MAG: helix-turn-helix domain-containing protein [Imperialibacter sp.]|uniref:TetR/AcrR family transcriptional regulator n=1 Tax=Imperialibacter sp. TaxID=2038411 RepID=UPI0032EFC69E